MKQFFNNINELNKYTTELELNRDTTCCQYCDQSDQFVSHGFVYKQINILQNQAVGKRLFCSNRYGRSGCGRTSRLYLAIQIPALHYSTTQMYHFILGLLDFLTIQQAYQKATSTVDPRNAYRWLTKLHDQLMNYRVHVGTHQHKPSYLSKTPRLQLLLPTLKSLFKPLGEFPCRGYQYAYQKRFI